MNWKQPESLYEFDDYRQFLRAFFEGQKGSKPFFSHRWFARKAGFKTSSFCAHVMEGKRNLTSDSLTKMLRGLDLDEQEAGYFRALVKWNQAKTHEERQALKKVVEDLRGKGVNRNHREVENEMQEFGYHSIVTFPMSQGLYRRFMIAFEKMRDQFLAESKQELPEEKMWHFRFQLLPAAQSKHFEIHQVHPAETPTD